MTRYFWILGLLLTFSSNGFAQRWTTDVYAALKQAQAQDKGILINFTGSDWCGWCIKLKSEVFDQPDFQKFAASNLILVEVDFPRKKALPAELKAANKKLAENYKITGYPTILLLDKYGRIRKKSGYKAGGPQNYINFLTEAPDINWRNKGGTTPAQPNKPETTPKP
ncbi:MAG: thioredoxin family protein [Verrucomicrobia bacterium]|nr:thioredoxin family protein [Verrucomicrobiota bacterium]